MTTRPSTGMRSRPRSSGRVSASTPIEGRRGRGNDPLVTTDEAVTSWLGLVSASGRLRPVRLSGGDQLEQSPVLAGGSVPCRPLRELAQFAAGLGGADLRRPQLLDGSDEHDERVVATELDDLLVEDPIAQRVRDRLGQPQRSAWNALCSAHRAVQPPSTTIVAPVMKLPASLASSISAPSSSFGSPRRGIGPLAAMNASPLSVDISAVISEVNHPGAMALTRTPLRAHCSASSRVRFTTAPFAVVYPVCLSGVEPTKPRIDAMLTMDPRWRSTMPAPASLARCHTAVRLTSSTRAKSSRLSRSIGLGSDNPALLTSTSSPPVRRSASPISRSRSEATPRSAVMYEMRGL